jgi:hypothetical protein
MAVMASFSVVVDGIRDSRGSSIRNLGSSSYFKFYDALNSLSSALARRSTLVLGFVESRDSYG